MYVGHMDKSSGQGGRPTSAEQGAATRRAILDAAIALIAEVGWGQVTTRAIADRAGVPHGAVGYHFTGKTDLLREAALTATTQALGEPIAMARHASSVWELVEGTFGWFAGGGLTDPSVALLLEAVREASRDPALRAPIAAVLRDYRTALADLVRADQERGSVRPDVPPESVAALIAALFDGVLLHLVLDPDLEARATAEAVRILLRGES